MEADIFAVNALMLAGFLLCAARTVLNRPPKWQVLCLI